MNVRNRQPDLAGYGHPRCLSTPPRRGVEGNVFLCYLDHGQRCDNKDLADASPTQNPNAAETISVARVLTQTLASSSGADGSTHWRV